MPQSRRPRASFDAATAAAPATRKAFFDAIRAGDLDVLAEMLSAHPGAVFWQEPFEAKDLPFAADNTPLMTATENRKTTSALLLLEHGAAQTMDMQNSRGWTALMFASWQGAAEVAEKLLWHGADTNLKMEGGHDARALAALRGHREIAQKIDAHREHAEGAAAFMEGTVKSTSLMRKIRLRRQPG